MGWFDPSVSPHSWSRMVPDYVYYLILNLNCPCAYITYINILLSLSLKVSKLVFWIGMDRTLSGTNTYVYFNRMFFFIICIIPLWCPSPNLCPLKTHGQSLPNMGNKTDVGKPLGLGMSSGLSSSISYCSRFLEPILWLVSWTLRHFFFSSWLSLSHFWPQVFTTDTYSRVLLAHPFRSNSPSAAAVWLPSSLVHTTPWPCSRLADH